MAGVNLQKSFQLSWETEGAALYDFSLQKQGQVLVHGTACRQTAIEVEAGGLARGEYLLIVTPYDASGVAGAAKTQSLCVRQDVFPYLGGSREELVQAVGGTWEYSEWHQEYEFADEGRNALLFAITPGELNCVTEIRLNDWESRNEYSLCGVSYQEPVSSAREKLLDAGWQALDQSEGEDTYQDAEGNQMSVLYRRNGVEAITVNLSESLLAERYAASGVQQAASQTTGTLRTTGDVNVRVGPGREYKLLGMLRAQNEATYLGESLVDERGVAWYRIEYKDGEGWVSSRYAELVQ